MLHRNDLARKITELEDKVGRLSAIVEEYEAHDETYCREYKMYLRLLSRTGRRLTRIRKMCERFSRDFECELARCERQIDEYHSKLSKNRDKR